MTVNLILVGVVLILAILLQAAVLFFKTARDGKAYRLVMQAADSRVRGDKEESLRLFERALAAAPHDPAIISHHSAALYRAGRKSDAEAGFRRALSLEKDLVEAHYGLGHLLLEGSPSEAAEHFSVVVMRDGDSSNGWHGRGLARLRSQRINEALADFTEALKRDPDSDAIMVNAAIAEILHGHFKQADAYLRSAIKSNPNNGEAFGNLGDLLALGKRYPEAAEAMLTALSLGAATSENRLELAYVLRKLGRNEEARQHLEKVVEAEPKNENALFQLAILYRNNNQIDKSKDMAGRAEALDERLKGDEHMNLENIGEYAKVPVFLGLAEEDIRRLVSVGKRRQLGANEVLADAGAAATSFFIIEEGNIMVKANDQLLADVGKGSVIGEVAYFDPRNRSASLVARNSAQVLEVSFAVLDVFIDEKPRAGQIILRNIGKIISERLRDADSHVSDKITWSFAAQDSL